MTRTWRHCSLRSARSLLICDVTSPTKAFDEQMKARWWRDNQCNCILQNQRLPNIWFMFFLFYYMNFHITRTIRASQLGWISVGSLHKPQWFGKLMTNFRKFTLMRSRVNGSAKQPSLIIQTGHAFNVDCCGTINSIRMCTNYVITLKCLPLIWEFPIRADSPLIVKTERSNFWTVWIEQFQPVLNIYT